MMVVLMAMIMADVALCHMDACHCLNASNVTVSIELVTLLEYVKYNCQLNV